MHAIPKPLAAALAAIWIAGCSPLATFDALAPYDGDGRKVAADLAYGPHPRQRLDVYAPTSPDATPAPVIVFLHGGAWSGGGKASYGFLGRALAARGFVTVVAAYRLVPEVRYPTFLEDNARAVAWTVAHAARFGGDPDRLALAGHSAGAYNAVMLALAPEFLDAAGVAPDRVDAVIGLAGPYDFLPLDHPSTRAAFGGADDLPATQPINRVRPDVPPHFLAAGARDRTVAPRHTRALSEALEAEGVPVEMRIYPNLGHPGILLALSRPLRSLAPVLDEATTFLRRHVDD